MISLSKVTNTIDSIPKINLTKKPIQASAQKIQSNCNLNLLPTSYCIPSNLFQKAKHALTEFNNEFGEVKSSTYICEKIKQAIKAGNEDSVEELTKLRQEYSGKVKRLRNNVSANKFSNNDDYIKALKGYVKENGSYMNCQECSDLMRDKLQKKGIKADNIFLYTVNKDNNRVSKAEHVFTVAGLDKNAVISNPSTWGNCYIVDGWSGICMPHQKGIKYFEEFFGIEPEKHRLMFEMR